MTRSTPTTTHSSPGRCRPRQWYPCTCMASQLGSLHHCWARCHSPCRRPRSPVSWTLLSLPGQAFLDQPHRFSDVFLSEPPEERWHQRKREREKDKQTTKREKQRASKRINMNTSQVHLAEIKRRLPSERGAAGGSVQNTNPLWACFISSCSLFNHRKSAERRRGTLDPQLD